MRSVLFGLVVLVLAFGSVGCSKADYTKNMRAATAQATTCVSVKFLLDEVLADKYDSTKTTVTTVCAEVSKFLDTGKIGDLPIDKAQEAVVKFMIEKGWTQYVPMVIAIFDIVAAQTVPIEKLGADNIAIIKLALDSAITSANTSRMEWRKQEAEKAAKLMKVKSWHARD